MIKTEYNYDLLGHNTFHLPAMCDLFIEYSSVADLQQVLKLEEVQQKPLYHIGGGSNLLFTSNFRGVVLHSAILGISIEKETDDAVYLRCGAGEVWDDFVACCVSQDLYGAENLSLIPGETGAAAVQNIGAYGVEIKDIIEAVETVEKESGKVVVFTNKDCLYGYRESVFKKELKDKYIVTHVLFRLSKVPSFKLDYGNISTEMAGKEITLRQVRETIIGIRKSKLPDPDEIGNAGSFFMNPFVDMSHFLKLKEQYPQIPHYPVSDKLVKIPAAWLIEQCGWKGKQQGQAAVHDRQCLVLVNKGGASASEIVELASQIMASVEVRFSVRLVPEVIYL